MGNSLSSFVICYRLGDQAVGDPMFDSLQKRAHEGYVSPTFLSWLHLARGEPESALNCAKEALIAQDPWVCTHRFISPAIVPADPSVDEFLAAALP